MTKEYIRKNIRLYVVVAAYNEEKVISPVIAGLQQLTKNIIIVDDGSTDNTAKIAASNGCIVIRHTRNSGQGAAIRSGINKAIEDDAEYIATFDADGQHDVNDLHKMLVALVEQKRDVVIGSRFLGSAPGIPIKRIVLLKIGILFTYIFSGVILTDVHNGLRIFTKAAAGKIDLSFDRMSHASVIIDSIIQEKLNFIEFPVTITYTKYSKMKGQKLMDILKIGVYLIATKTVKKAKKIFSNGFTKE